MSPSWQRLVRVATIAVFVTSGCSTEGAGGTTGQRITLATRFQPHAHVSATFTTGTDWEVRLHAASLAIEGLYYFDGPPAFARLERTPVEWLKRFVIGTAYAHPQHYVAGNALGQMVTPTSVDLFEPARLPEGTGVTGVFRSGRVKLPDLSAGPHANVLDGHVASARGMATKGDRIVHFRVAAALSDLQRTSPSAEIDGCVFEKIDVTRDGTVTLTVTPRVWFNLVDFSTVESGSEDAPTDIVIGQIAHRAFALGVAQLSAYHFGYTP
jgi:hypothetical protein